MEPTEVHPNSADKQWERKPPSPDIQGGIVMDPQRANGGREHVNPFPLFHTAHPPLPTCPTLRIDTRIPMLRALVKAKWLLYSQWGDLSKHPFWGSRAAVPGLRSGACTGEGEAVVADRPAWM